MTGLPVPSLSAIVEEGAVRILRDSRPRAAVAEDGESAPPRVVRRRGRIVCQACGAEGHNRANRQKCPMRRPPAGGA